MKFVIKDSEKAREMVEKMDLRALINQCMCPNAFPHMDFSQIEEYGSLFVFGAERQVLKEKLDTYKSNCKIPPLVAGDFECGPGSMIHGATRYPSMMGCSQANSETLAYEMGKGAALEGLEVGYNWTFAPVVDLVGIYDSPVVSTRSAGNHPDQVVKIAGAYMRGVQENGMLATIKHFPGDGFDIYDQHLTTPSNPMTREEWWDRSGRCFKDMIEKGAMCVMPGHIALPAFDEKDPETGFYPPATLSKRLMTDLLKGELGFEGLIVSDAIEMGGAVNFKNYYEACADFFEGGGDVLLFPNMNGFHEEMEKLVKNGKLHLNTLKDRAYRVLCLKDQMGLLEAKDPLNVISEDHDASRKMVDLGVTLIRDRKGILPFNIQKNTRVLHLVIANNPEEHRTFIDQMTQEIRKYSDFVDEKCDPGPGSTFSDVREKKYDLIICSIGHMVSWGLNIVRLHGPMARNMMAGWMKLGTPVVFVAFAHPFIHKEYEMAADTILNTYGTTDYTAERVVKGIVGELPFNTKLWAHD